MRFPDRFFCPPNVAWLLLLVCPWGGPSGDAKEAAPHDLTLFGVLVRAFDERRFRALAGC